MQNWDFFGTKFGLWSHLGPSTKFGTSLEGLILVKVIVSHLPSTIRLGPTEIHRTPHPCSLNWISGPCWIYQECFMLPSGKGTAPVRKMTTWFTLSASCEYSRYHMHQYPNTHISTWISATTLVGPACSQEVETSLPDTIRPNIAILQKHHIKPIEMLMPNIALVQSNET